MVPVKLDSEAVQGSSWKGEFKMETGLGCPASSTNRSNPVGSRIFFTNCVGGEF
jgi:hypothetical protein